MNKTDSQRAEGKEQGSRLREITAVLHKNNISRVLCRCLFQAISVAYTIRSQEELEHSKKNFDLFIFEGFEPVLPGEKMQNAVTIL